MSINMSCSDGSYDLSMNMVLNCAAKAWIPGNFLIPIMTCYQIPLRQFLNLIKTYYQIVPALAAQSVLKLLADDVPYTNHPRLQSDRNAGSA